MTFVPGDTVGPYEIVERQGQGGMATVYRAYHAALDRFVALKFLNPAYSDDDSFLARFQREARVVARLEHPNIVPIYDFAEHEGRPYLVMKFIDGETLKERLFRGHLTLDEGMRVIEAVGHALIFAHKQGVLHRDIKPSNILIAEDGSIFLADFGLARLARMGSSTISSEMLLGTPHYISPEQAQGTSDLDERTDIYSFGVVLYELIVGQVPFDSDSPFSIIHDQIYEPLPMPRDINPDVPEAVERVLLKALAKPKAERYASAKGLLTAFLAAATGDRIGVLRPPSETLDDLGEVSELEEAAIAWSEEPDIEPPSEASALPPAQELAVEDAPQKQRTWTLVVAGVILACACLAVVFNARGLINRAWNQTPTVRVITPAQRTLMPAGTAIATVGPAQHLQTAEALSTAGEIRDAVEELVTAGEQFLDEKSYVQAAKVFQWLADELGGPSSVGFQMRDSLIEALFLGATMPGMDQIIIELKADYPDWSVITTVEARVLLLGGEMEGSAQLIDSALLANPDDALALALQVEWLIASEKYQDAERIVNRLVRRPLQPWLSDHVAHLSTEIENAT